MAMKIKKIKTKFPKVPIVSKGKHSEESFSFPLDHYSYSSLVQFTTNPVLFKIKYINGDRYDTTSGTSQIIGQAFHAAMEVFYGGISEMKPKDEQEAIEFGLKTGLDFLDKYPEGFIKYNDTIPNKQRMFEIFSTAYNFYIRDRFVEDYEILEIEQEIEEVVNVNWRGQSLNLPIKLKGFPDQIIKTKDGKIKIKDFKTCRSFSDPEKIDGRKIIQAVQYYLLTYAKYGIEPYSMTYEEIKTTKNSDNSKQVKVYEIVYSENELYFDFYFRLYHDITEALNGKMVYVPNVDTLFDNEVAIVSYINRLDISEEKANEMKRLKVENITDLLKKKIQNAGNMRKFLKSAEQQFISAKNLNYERMEIHEKITTKLMEFGMILQFDSKIEGASVDLYRFTPSIGLKMSRLQTYASDIEQVVGKSGIRVAAPIPNTSLVGFEIPRLDRTFPNLPKSQGYELAIGQTVAGEIKRFDVRQAPHLLIGGSTGSGKSVFLHSVIKQLRKTNAELKLVDPKQVEFAEYPSYSEKEEISSMIKKLVDEMDSRYQELKKLKKKDYISASLNPIFLIIDEYADLVMTTAKKKKSSTITETNKKGIKITHRESDSGEETVTEMIQRLAQKGRAAGIHIILATQRASTKIINGDIKVNFPVKVVFRMAKEIDSRVMIDEPGAEKLLGKGDCLFVSETGSERLQAFNV